MDAAPLPRKLAAIFYADVAGYSRLTGEDEDATHRRLSASLDRIARTVGQYDGRVMHYAGDAVLAVFEAVTDTLSCAGRIQIDLAASNAELRDDRQIRFRIGLNLGDVIEDRGDVYGDGVNVAARLESLAEPGGICISESVRTAAGNRLPFTYEFMGEQAVKNIADPVRAYAARLAPGSTVPGPGGRAGARPPAYRTVALTAMIVLAAGTGLVAWYEVARPRETRAAAAELAFPLPEKPSIAVMPFREAGGGPENSFLADGTSDGVRWALARVPSLFVVDSGTSRQLDERPMTPKEAAESLGVRYVLTGSVQTLEDRVRIGARLVDTTSGRYLWADVFDGRHADLFDLQERVSRRIVDELEVKLTEGEMIRIWRRQTENPDAYLRFREGLDAYKRRTRQDNARARGLFEAALALDPSFAEASCQLGWTYVTAVYRRWEKDAEQNYARGEALAREAIETDPTYPHAYALLGSILVWRDHAPERALPLFEKAVSLEPNHGTNLAEWAWTLVMAGRPGDALDAIESAMRVSPYYPDHYLMYLGATYLGLERHDEAATALSARLARNPRSTLTKVFLVAAHQLAGSPDEARRVAGALMSRRPGFDLKFMPRWMPYQDAAARERILDAAEQGGLPRTSPRTRS